MVLSSRCGIADGRGYSLCGERIEREHAVCRLSRVQGQEELNKALYSYFSHHLTCDVNKLKTTTVTMKTSVQISRQHEMHSFCDERCRRCHINCVERQHHITVCIHQWNRNRKSNL